MQATATIEAYIDERLSEEVGKYPHLYNSSIKEYRHASNACVCTACHHDILQSHHSLFLFSLSLALSYQIVLATLRGMQAGSGLSHLSDRG
ncbi:hypothetical protein DPX16_11470 [Anabarilius grahami]|uniref:Uncharacterized protein n=1 Tax=Anabarilius grahami TaxID=495550 RepID=A0A3N0YHQ1_ANAGA|nr:hypothetical protein DPX16_11470 [Anabarilius grahami]